MTQEELLHNILKLCEAHSEWVHEAVEVYAKHLLGMPLDKSEERMLQQVLDHLTESGE